MSGGRIDYHWYEETSVNPVVAIEHENLYEDTYDSEIPKLLESSVPLRILITYVYIPPSKRALVTEEQVRDEILDDAREVVVHFRNPHSESQLMIVIGSELEDPRKWWSYRFQFAKRKWVKIKA